MTSDDSKLISLSSSAERHPPLLHELPQLEFDFPALSSHVSMDYFSPTDSQILSPNIIRQSLHDRAREISVIDAPAGENFCFQKYLQDIWNQGVQENISFRQTGVVFKDLRVIGLGADIKYQDTILSVVNPLNLVNMIQKIRHPPVKDILQGFEGVVRPGEMLLVLGQPGSGCTSLLKVLANQRKSFHAIEGTLSYDGFTPEHMAKHHRGDIGYSPEDDIHFPSLSIRQTLNVSTAARTPHKRAEGYSRKKYVDNIVDTLGMVLGLTHAFNTPVGDETIRGVSGGEKKRVSIAEMLSMNVRLACWDNSTGGLDASTALEFARALRISTNIAKITTIVSIYQASENIYNLFDKVAVIYEGRMSYFGPADQARQYFIDMGYEPANRQTTADFLVGVTHGPSRTPCSGFESRVPRTPAEFAEYFVKSPLGQENAQEVRNQLYDTALKDPIFEYRNSARGDHTYHMEPGPPYTISLSMQARILIRRRIQIVSGDTATRAIMLFDFISQGLILGFVYFNIQNTTDAYFSRGSAIFFAILFNVLSSMAEIPALYIQRPIIARHHNAALYHPFIDALAVTIVDIPITAFTVLVFDLILYFMTHLQRRPSNFFIFYLFTCSISLTMKAFFRSLTVTFTQQPLAQAIAGLTTLAFDIYTGYSVPGPDVMGALRWIMLINPMVYSFEALVANEFHDLHGQCSTLVPSGPGYMNVSLANQVCTVLGSQPGSDTVNGDLYIGFHFNYKYFNLWRNFGIIMAFWLGCVMWYLFMTERRSHNTSGGANQLIFKRGTTIPDAVSSSRDEEKGENSSPTSVTNHKMTPDVRGTNRAEIESRGIFSWHNINYEISLPESQSRRLLEDVSGYVVPGKLTALMGESGAGKTTLLNALADRVRTDVVTGSRFVNGDPLPSDFASQTGYCQQTDVHLETSTVREALRFSAVLRQPASVSRQEKYDYVEEVIRLCDMESYADAIVGSVGEGLNVEQRKRLTIGVELAAKPQLLLILDEPTSGLSSQSAWVIIKFLRSLADRGQAILCTIHQPSAELFQAFDMLLLLGKGGQTCYFGDIGSKAATMINYFQSNGGRTYEGENPAEYMLDVIGAGTTKHSTIDWYLAWRNSPERQGLEYQLREILRRHNETPAIKEEYQTEFPAPFSVQLSELTRRAFLDYLRSPAYLISKYILNIFAGLFIGFSFFKAKNNLQGAQLRIFAVFMGVIPCISHSNLLQGPFLRFRQIYETREQASKMYHWIPLVTTSMIVEIPLNILGASIYFLCWYWTVGFPGDSSRIGFGYLFYGIVFPIYYTTLSQAIAAASPNGEVAGLVSTFLFSFIIIFTGVTQPFSQLATFERWIYHISPFTYFIEGVVTSGLENQAIQCSLTEIVSIMPPSATTCQEYMGNFINVHGGYLLNPTDASNCQFCPTDSSNALLATLHVHSDRWRDVGFMVAYIMFNVFLLYSFMYIFRIRMVGSPLRSVTNRVSHLKLRARSSG